MSRHQPYRVLFVDLGNASPAGEGMLRHLAERAGAGHLVECDSAGAIPCQDGLDRQMLEAARKRGIPIKGNVRQLETNDLGAFDLVLTLDLEGHVRVDELRAMCGGGSCAEVRDFHALCRTHGFALAPGPHDDGQGGFERVFDWLEAGCAALLEEICGRGTVWVRIAERIGMKPVTIQLAAGGCINECAVLAPVGLAEKVFVKCNAASKLPMFAAEVEALEALAATRTVRVPKPIAHGIVGQHSYLVLEYIRMRPGKPQEFHLLGEQLAELHRHVSPEEKFGWPCDNVIGESPQQNPPTGDWATFFAENRIGFQLELAQRMRDRAIAHGEKLLCRIPELLGGHESQPSLLHGDLWGGNAGFAIDGVPVLYDPASYYGDRETDVAFSEMFGGFAPDFYGGYRAAYPLEDGYERRRDLYNLYHVLNHYALFGGSYGDQAEGIVRRLLVGF